MGREWRWLSEHGAAAHTMDVQLPARPEDRCLGARQRGPRLLAGSLPGTPARPGLRGQRATSLGPQMPLGTAAGGQAALQTTPWDTHGTGRSGWPAGRTGELGPGSGSRAHPRGHPCLSIVPLGGGDPTPDTTAHLSLDLSHCEAVRPWDSLGPRHERSTRRTTRSTLDAGDAPPCPPLPRRQGLLSAARSAPGPSGAGEAGGWLRGGLACNSLRTHSSPGRPASIPTREEPDKQTGPAGGAPLSHGPGNLLWPATPGRASYPAGEAQEGLEDGPAQAAPGIPREPPGQ